MTDRIEEIFQQVMDEDCSEPLRRFADLVRQDEREACAKLCDEKALYFQYDFIPPYDVADSCAEEIRARSKHD
jgi:hypothetical protein